MRNLVAKLLCLLATLSSWPPTMAAQESQYTQSPIADIARGQRLADVMLCAMCHSPMTLDGGLQMFNPTLRLTGGVKVVAPPDGTFFSKNLTPDLETGIGAWSFTELANAITKGIGRDGRGLRVMPSHYYRDISNDDLNALIAYLRSVPPVKKSIPTNTEMAAADKIAAGVRLLMPFMDWPSQDWYYGDFRAQPTDGATAKVPQPSVQKHDPLVVQPTRTSPEIEQGKHLVTVAACAFCHTPVGMFGQNQKLALTGGFKVEDPVCGTVYSKNLTPDPDTGLGRWSDEEVVRAIRHGVAKDNRVLCPTIMPWQAYAKFTDAEVKAIVTYLRAIPSVRREIPATTAVKGTDIKAQKFTLGDSAK